MNLFYLDQNPRLAAQYHCDIHVNKMTSELCQMLCTAHHELGSYEQGMWDPAYINNPVTKWVRQSIENYYYALDLFNSLLCEYKLRYKKTHNCEQLYALLVNHPKDMLLHTFTPPVLAMPDCYKSSDPVSSYRAYYVGEKNQFANWRNGAPFWWPKDLKGYVNHVIYARSELQRCLSSGGNFGEVSETIRRSYDETIGQSCQEIG